MGATDPPQPARPSRQHRSPEQAAQPDAGTRPPAGLAAPRPGLSGAEVSERIARGLVNDVPDAPTRTVGQILRANLVTPFNLLLGSLLVVILVVGPLQDALFGIVLVTNALIGIVQELRAKRTLERLALISAPRGRVWRDGRLTEVDLHEVVQDDVLEVGPGDQIVVDGEVLAVAGAELDESLLSGEAEPVAKAPGDEVLSGSFVVAGSAVYRATRVGRQAYATRLAEEARRFTLVRSELRAGIDRIIKLVAWVLVPTAVLLFTSQLLSAHEGIGGGLRGAVAGTVAMVPEGLVLLTGITFAVSVVRLGRRNVLVQELPAVETLARVDVVCFDKTGTLTSGDLALQQVIPLRSGADAGTGGGRSGSTAAGDDGPGSVGPSGVEAALGALAAADPNPNATLRAIAGACPAPSGWEPHASVPFSSQRKWSAASFAEHGTWVLGAPEVMLGGAASGDGVLRRSEALAVQGRRVLLLATAPGPVDDEALPRELAPRALVVLGDQLRADAAPTVGWFLEQGVGTKVLSGDHPRTVAAIAGQAGIPGADDPVDARLLATDRARLAETLEQRSVFGRVVPEQKRTMVDALKGREHVVAMTGDGVNDVLALKDADLGVAMGSGSAASRAVAQLVLLDGRFATLPAVVAEGRRVIANIERVAKLFVTKTVYATVLAIAVGLLGVPFPFLPRHLALISSLTIGIPGFFLALEPNERRARPGFVPRVLRFAVPVGLTAALATFAAYRIAHGVVGVSLDQARTTATLTLAGIGLVALRLVMEPMNALRRAVLGGMVAAFVVVLAVPWLRAFFALALPPLGVAVGAGVLVVVVGAAMVVVSRLLRA